MRKPRAHAPFEKTKVEAASGKWGLCASSKENTMADDLQKTDGFVDKLAALDKVHEARPLAQGPCRETAMSHVRRIAVYVDEPHPGHFFWVLTEECDDAIQWRELESAELSYEIWRDALHAGVKALEGYASDERIGPRAPDATETPGLPASPRA
jgi:hypothetical protein